MAKDSVESETGEKANLILDACEKRDVTQLRQLASSEGGLIRDDIRRSACGPIVRLAILCLCSSVTRANPSGQRPRARTG